MEMAIHASSDTVPDGQPTGDPISTKGQVAEESSVEEPSVEEGSTEKQEESTPQFTEKDYKSLQAEFTERSQELKGLKDQMAKLESFGGVEQVAEWVSYLSKNPEFAKWVQSQQGGEESVKEAEPNPEYDEDTQRAIDLIRKEAESIADQRIKDVLKSQIEPIANKYKEQSLEANMKQMDEKYGAEWRDVRNTMAKLANNLPDNIQDNPDFETIEDLYWKAMRVDGKFNDYAKSVYEKEILSKKSHMTEKPSSSSAKIAPKKANSMIEAFELAKQMQSN